MRLSSTRTIRLLLLAGLLHACDSSTPEAASDADLLVDDAGADGPDTSTNEPDATIEDGATQEAAARDAYVPTVCTAVAPTSCPTPAPRYADVSPIIERRCVGCHSPLWTGPWPLDTYGHVLDWQDTIRANLLDCTMPPPGVDGGGPLPEEESRLILTFIRCGLPM